MTEKERTSERITASSGLRRKCPVYGDVRMNMFVDGNQCSREKQKDDLSLHSGSADTNSYPLTSFRHLGGSCSHDLPDPSVAGVYYLSEEKQLAVAIFEEKHKSFSKKEAFNHAVDERRRKLPQAQTTIW